MIVNRLGRIGVVIAAGALAATVGCSSEAPSSERVGKTDDAIIKGKASDSSQDAVVLLLHYDGNPQGGIGECTASLIAPNLLITARHCVADSDDSTACTTEGKPLAGGVIYKQHKPDTLYVFKGTNRPSFGGGQVLPDGQGAKIFVPNSKTLCNSDIALVLLKKDVPGVPILPIRLESGPENGESVTSVGWGVTDKTRAPSVRQQRSGVKIEHVGPYQDQTQVIGTKEFGVGESICSGDSGGPALATESNAVLGVVSRGGNGSPPAQGNPASQCIDATNLYTQVAPFKDLILQAFEASGNEPWIEGSYDPRKTKDGEECDGDDACRSGICSDSVCLTSCAESECPEGLVCDDSGEKKFCKTPSSSNDDEANENGATSEGTTTSSGCDVAPSRSLARNGRLSLLLASIIGLFAVFARSARRSGRPPRGP